jgi:hypothetical protein
VTEIRPLTAEEVDLVDRKLPLDRLDQSGGEWLIAWDGGEPVDFRGSRSS